MAQKNEVLVSAFVDIDDFFKEISNEMFMEMAEKRSLTLPASGFSSNSMLEELRSRLEDGANPLSEKDIIEQLDLSLGGEGDEAPYGRLHPLFESLQHQQLYEDFEEARKNINPAKLIEIFSKLNRPAMNKRMILIH